MSKTYLEMIKDAGVVGSGGAGFPTHIKINNTADVVIANGAECEPLLRVDRQIMEVYPEKVVEGLKIVMEISNAKRGVICLKEKYHHAVEKLGKAVENAGNKNISIHLLENYYPAGDEQQIVFEVTGKIVPIGGLPIDVGAIVNNISTLCGVKDACDGMPVTDKFVTITGEVDRPMTVKAPIGTPVKKLIELAGGPKDGAGYTIILGGPAMGRIENDWMAPVTKTLGGVIVLPSGHQLIKKKTVTIEDASKLAKSVCSQCSFCTQLCPRNALGLGTEPHKVMRAVGYGESAAIGDINKVFSCCDCGLCTYYACNMGLSPSKMVTTLKSGLAKKGIKPVKVVPFEVSEARNYKKVPTSRFIERLGLGSYDIEAPINTEPLYIDSVRISLRQHIGVPASPRVNLGDIVQKGDLIAGVEEGKLGANIHSSITGRVASVSGGYIEITAF